MRFQDDNEIDRQQFLRDEIDCAGCSVFHGVELSVPMQQTTHLSPCIPRRSKISVASLVLLDSFLVEVQRQIHIRWFHRLGDVIIRLLLRSPEYQDVREDPSSFPTEKKKTTPRVQTSTLARKDEHQEILRSLTSELFAAVRTNGDSQQSWSMRSG